MLHNGTTQINQVVHALSVLDGKIRCIDFKHRYTVVMFKTFAHQPSVQSYMTPITIQTVIKNLHIITLHGVPMPLIQVQEASSVIKRLNEVFTITLLILHFDIVACDYET